MKFVRYKNEVLELKVFYGKPCLWIQKPSQRNMPKMQFVGGYPNEWCIFIDDLTEHEKSEIRSLHGMRLNIDEEIKKLESEIK